MPKHANHRAELDSLSRIEGQIRGIKAMIEDDRYCIDILTQTRAVHAALRRVERNVLAAHLDSCARAAFESGDEEARREKIEEILTLFDWEGGRSR
jgi:DNA-binding FrmR family transcriptional regulator